MVNLISDYDYEIKTQAGITHLKILSQRDGKACQVCEDADGNIYELDYAYNNQVLPHPDCKNEECRCNFLPIIKE